MWAGDIALTLYFLGFITVVGLTRGLLSYIRMRLIYLPGMRETLSRRYPCQVNDTLTHLTRRISDPPVSMGHVIVSSAIDQVFGRAAEPRGHGHSHGM